MSTEILLTRGFVAVVDDEDLDRVLAAGAWCAHVPQHKRTAYAVRAHARASGRRSLLGLHNFITGLPFVDHMNGDGLDNRRANLRSATKSQNAMNSRRRSDNTSGFKGVSLTTSTGRWRALIVIGGRRRHLGYFEHAADAARAYDRAALDLFGDFARLNFPENAS